MRTEFQLLYSLYKLTTIHKIPCLPFFWPFDDNLKYLSEGLVYNDNPKFKWKQLPPGSESVRGKKFEEISDLFQFIDLCIFYFIKNKKKGHLLNERIVKRHILKINPQHTTLYNLNHVMLKHPDGGNIKNFSRIATKDFLKFLENRTNLKRNNEHFSINC